jgi:hypothetical protein
LLGSLGLAAVVLFAWFPATSLVRQRTDISRTQAELSTLHHQDFALGQEQKSLSNLGEIGRIAREQYQLVSPGQQAYEVLPPSGAPGPGAVFSGDPGLQGPVTPSAAAELPQGGAASSSRTTSVPPSVSAGAHGTSPASGSSASGSSGGLVSRMVHALEFWR